MAGVSASTPVRARMAGPSDAGSMSSTRVLPLLGERRPLRMRMVVVARGRGHGDAGAGHAAGQSSGGATERRGSVRAEPSDRSPDDATVGTMRTSVKPPDG